MSGKRVLIVDDALFMRNTLRDIFASSGFTVAGEADDGVQAVNLFRELKPDLVTMDIVMLQRAQGDLGLYVTDVHGIELLADDANPLPERQGAAVAMLDLPEGPVKLVDPELLARAIDNLVEA